MALLVINMESSAAHWKTLYYATNAIPWDTTSSVADLDAEVGGGAVLLKYPGQGYVRAEYHQYPAVCGPATLTMVLKTLGYTQPTVPVSMPCDVDEPAGSAARCEVNFFGSMEHLMWLGYHRYRRAEGHQHWNGGDPRFMTTAGLLNTNGLANRATVSWRWYGKGVGTGNDSNSCSGLPGVMNYYFASRWGLGCRDACPLTACSATPQQVTAFKRIVKGFVDHGIPLVLGIEHGGHFNALMGYKGDPANSQAAFYIYTAEPLDGWGRSAATQPGTWRRMRVTAESMFHGAGLIWQYVCWNQHLNGGCEPNGWATAVDRLNGTAWLTGRFVPELDPLDADPVTSRP